MRRPFATVVGLLLAAAMQMLGVCIAAAEDIRNVATLSFQSGGVTRTLASNPVTLQGPTQASSISAHGFVFNYRTGQPVAGARISLIEEATGRIVETVVSGDVSTAQVQAIEAAMSGPAADPESADAAWRGLFVFSPARPGTYHLLVSPPKGMRIAARAPRAPTSFHAPDGELLEVSDGSRGEPFELTSHLLLDLDIPIEATPEAQLVIEKTAGAASVSLGDFVDYQINIKNVSSDSAAIDLVLEDAFPAGFTLATGTLRVGGQARTPTMTSGGMRAPLGDLDAGESLTISYALAVGPGARSGRAINRATVTTLDGRASAVAEAAVRVSAPLTSDAITIVGRVTTGECAAPVGLANVRVVMETGAYAITDRQGLYHFEGVTPGRHVVQMDVASLPVGSKPAACGSSTRRAGSDISQFIEAQGGLTMRADFHATTPTTNQAEVAVPAGGDRTANIFAGQAPGIDWVLPAADTNPRAPALRIAVKHGQADKVKLTVNGQPVSAATFEGVATEKASGVSISQWRGVAITDGDNTLQADVTSPDGRVTQLARSIHYANSPARAMFVPEKSKVMADGASRPVIAARILDAFGKPVRMGLTGGVRVNAPYRLAAETDAQQARQLAGTERFSPVYRVIDDTGLALIELEPTTTPGWTELIFDFPNANQRQAEPVRAWLSADREDWIIVGFAAGTVGFETLAGHTDNMPEGKTETLQEGEASLYAKGRVLGRWLLTLAYDSNKRRDETSLLSTIDPDRYYSLYGDASATGYDAASAGNLYLRLERDTFYAMFGDFETGFTDTQLARYSRTLHGVKAESAGEQINVAAFGAETSQHNLRDEIAGAGVSGPYRLSVGAIVSNTDHVRIETRDRLHSERVLASREMARHIDYEIDYATGALLFRQPVLSKDSAFNPVFIVATYETWGEGVSASVSGARVTTKVGDTVRVGATLVDNGQLDGGRMAGLDLVARPDDATTVRLEAATTDVGSNKATAWLAEVQRTDGVTDLVAYARRQDEGFGLGQSPLGQAGSEKIGVDGRHKLSSAWSLMGSASRQRALGVGAARSTAEARVEHTRDDGVTFAGARATLDETAQADTQSSQLLVGASRLMMDRRLEISESSDIGLGGDASDAYPTRHRVSAGYALTDAIRLNAGYEMTPEGAQKGSAAQIGIDARPWAGARLSSTLSQSEIVERGERTFAQYGLSQSLPIGERWTVDATYDGGRRVSGASDAPAATTPITSGAIAQSDFDAMTAGATYRAPTWSWNGRVEYRTAESDDQIGLISNSLNQLNAVTSVATSFRATSRTDRLGRAAHRAEGRVNAALRPADSPWTLLARSQLIYDSIAAGAVSSHSPIGVATGSESLRFVSELSVNFDAGPSNPWTGSLYIGTKLTNSEADYRHVHGRADILGGDLRYDIAPNVDVGVSAAVRRNSVSGQTRFAFGPSVGWSPADNLWFSVGHNFVGFRDREFEQDRYTRQGTYLTFRVKFDQTTLGQGVAQ